MMEPSALVLQDAFKQYCHDQDKIMTPDATIKRFQQRLSKSDLQILDKIVRIDNGRLGIPVYFSICGSDAHAAIGNAKQMGKGATPSQAKASAVMELAERFSLFSFYHNTNNYVYASHSQLKQPRLNFEQIAQSVNDTSDDLPIARKFFDQLPLNWTWAYNLTRQESVMIPFDWFWAINEFNGSSAGNCNEEALCQGICEVIERHVCDLISRQQLRVPSIDLSAIKDPVALELIKKYQKAGIELYISDFTVDMGIPSIGALAWDPATFPSKSEIVWTAGTTPNAAKALCRALTEVAQLAGDFNSNSNYVASGLPKFNSIESAAFIIDSDQMVDLKTLPDISDNNIKHEVQHCIDALAKRQMDVFVVDVHHPDLNIPAFYTIIPGTRFRERAAHCDVTMIMAKIITQSFSPNAAIAQLQRLNTQLPNKYYLYFYQGQMNLNQGDTHTALSCLKQAVELEPPTEDLASIYLYIGICYKKMTQYKDALKVLQKGDRLDPERTDILNLMGFCYYKLQEHEKAIACFKRLIALNPSSAIDYANLAVNYRATGKNEKAVEHYKLALALDPNIDFAKAHLQEMGGAM